ncbi:hypothetical protein ACFX2C_028090 [Malus domestica]
MPCVEILGLSAPKRRDQSPSQFKPNAINPHTSPSPATSTASKQLRRRRHHLFSIPPQISTNISDLDATATKVSMVFLSWGRPSPQEQKACIDRSGSFNYDPKFKGATAKSLSSLQEDQGLSKDGFLLNHSRNLVGSGLDAYEKGKTALQDWRHFGLNWAFVDPKTPVQNGVKFCVCVKEFLPWVMMPLQVVYVNENKRSKQAMASFRFGGGTLQGHLLAGEERFSIELDEKNQVWYEILSFSKPAHLLSFIGYPYVMLRQKYFARQSTNAIMKHLNASKS